MFSTLNASAEAVTRDVVSSHAFQVGFSSPIAQRDSADADSGSPSTMR